MYTKKAPKNLYARILFITPCHFPLKNFPHTDPAFPRNRPVHCSALPYAPLAPLLLQLIIK